MTPSSNRRIPVWLWAATLLILGVAAGLLIFTDRRDDLSDTFRLDLAPYKEVAPERVLYEEAAQLDPKLEDLRAVAVGTDGRVYVCGDENLVIYDPDGKEAGRRPLSAAPNCVAVAPDGTIFLGLRDHVEVLRPDGAPQAVWDRLDEDSFITSIALGEDGVYVADAAQRVVLRFDRNGALLAKIGEADEARKIPGFIVPNPRFDVAVDPQGAFWAANPGRHGLENYRANGDLVSAWYRPSMEIEGFCGCCNPIHIAFRSDGMLVTAEKGIARIKLYTPDQALAGLVAAPSAFEDTEESTFSGELETPIRDLAVDARNRVLVVDGRRRLVRIFAPKEQAS